MSTNEYKANLPAEVVELNTYFDKFSKAFVTKIAAENELDESQVARLYRVSTRLVNPTRCVNLHHCRTKYEETPSCENRSQETSLTRNFAPVPFYHDLDAEL